MLSKPESPCKVQENLEFENTKLCKPKITKKKKPKQAFPIPDFCKECREFVLNLKFHNKAVHGATCDLCLDVFDNLEKMEKHKRQFHKIKKSKESKEKLTEASKPLKNTSFKDTEVKQTNKNLDKSTELSPFFKNNVSSSSKNNNNETSSNLTPITPVSQKLSQVNISGTDKNNNDKTKISAKKTKTQTSIMKFFKVQD